MFRFKNWRIYQEARKLRLIIHNELLPKLPKEENFGLKNQIRRAIDSVILNIAEGSYRKSDKDFAHFLNQSLASLYEFVSCCDLCLDSKYIKSDEHQEFLKDSENLASQISAFSRHLNNSKK